MKILYLHQYFITPKEPGATRSYWVCRKLLEKGHQVTMLTSSSTVDKNKGRGKVNIDGIDVIYLDVPYHGSMSITKRFWAFIKFAVLSSIHCLRISNVDMVIATSTPLTIGIPALIRKTFRGTPFVFEVRDLWPEVPIQLGGLTNKYAIRLAIWLEKTIYKQASHIIALSPGMEKGVIEKGTPEHKVTMIPNMSKPDEFFIREKNQDLLNKLHLKNDSFKVIYFGALGLANDLHYILKSAKQFDESDGVEFLIAGGGGVEHEIRETIQQERLKHVKMLGNFPMNMLSEIVNLADVSLVTFLNIPILATNSPNKLFDSLSAGKPIIVNSPGWTKELVENEKCGLYVNPEDPADLTEKILFLKDHPELCKEMGGNSRKLAEETFDKDILCEQIVQTLTAISPI